MTTMVKMMNDETGLPFVSVTGLDLKEAMQYEKMTSIITEFAKENSGEMQTDEMEGMDGNGNANTVIDECFAYYFLNDEMMRDMPEITRDFFLHCGEDLPEFGCRYIRWELDIRERGYSHAMEYRIMSLIHAMAGKGNRYCIFLMKYLYKTYHKEEYKFLKRFSSVKMLDLLRMGDNTGQEQDGVFFVAYGMCPLLNIPILDDYRTFYDFMQRKDHLASIDDRKKEMLPDERQEKVSEIIDSYMLEEEKKKVPYAAWKDAIRFFFKCWYFLGMPGLKKDLLESDVPREQKELYMDAYAVLSHMHPGEEYIGNGCFDIIQIYAVFYLVTRINLNSFAELLKEMGILIGIDKDCSERGEAAPVFQFVYEEEGNATETPVSVCEVAEHQPDDRAELKEENERLRKKVRLLEQDKKDLWDEKQKVRSLENELEQIKLEQENGKAELTALRSFAYGISEEYRDHGKKSTKDMIRALNSKKIVIIGGHANWHNKLRQIFPHWYFIAPGSCQMVNRRMLEGVDKVYFFTDYISHTAYNKFIDTIRNNKIPFGYLHQVNIEQTLVYMNNDMIK